MASEKKQKDTATADDNNAENKGEFVFREQTGLNTDGSPIYRYWKTEELCIPKLSDLELVDMYDLYVSHKDISFQEIYEKYNLTPYQAKLLIGREAMKKKKGKKTPVENYEKEDLLRKFESLKQLLNRGGPERKGPPKLSDEEFLDIYNQVVIRGIIPDEIAEEYDTTPYFIEKFSEITRENRKGPDFERMSYKPNIKYDPKRYKIWKKDSDRPKSIPKIDRLKEIEEKYKDFIRKLKRDEANLKNSIKIVNTLDDNADNNKMEKNNTPKKSEMPDFTEKEINNIYKRVVIEKELPEYLAIEHETTPYFIEKKAELEREKRKGPQFSRMYYKKTIPYDNTRFEKIKKGEKIGKSEQVKPATPAIPKSNLPVLSTNSTAASVVRSRAPGMPKKVIAK